MTKENSILTDIKKAFAGCNLYISTPDEKETPEDLSDATIIADGYEGATPYVRPVNDSTAGDIKTLIDDGLMEIIKFPVNISNSQEDMLWPGKGFQGQAFQLRFTR